ncbi:hypothetical protein Q5P01_003841 [Channa striata]|uniref:Uncharacterized protein n=1 Tax=Channa striata TaxID=64152 RepID=A0AA88NN46_CHASR|nr:hypothetical protein Q5P01_003841 [Channa striata]
MANFAVSDFHSSYVKCVKNRTDVHPNPTWRSRLPLDQASDDTRQQVEALQTTLHCCGLFSYSNWRDDIPQFCLYRQQDELEENFQHNFVLNLFWQKKSIFTQPCFPLIMESVTTNANVTLAVVFTLFAMLDKQ